MKNGRSPRGHSIGPGRIENRPRSSPLFPIFPTFSRGSKLTRPYIPRPRDSDKIIVSLTTIVNDDYSKNRNRNGIRRRLPVIIYRFPFSVRVFRSRVKSRELETSRKRRRDVRGTLERAFRARGIDTWWRTCWNRD